MRNVLQNILMNENNCRLKCTMSERIGSIEHKSGIQRDWCVRKDMVGMDGAVAVKPEESYDIRRYCHVNTNEEGDRFVGIKADSHGAMVCFPVGYELPKTESQIRADMRRLIQVLGEFTAKEDRLLAADSFGRPGKVEFPIQAYRHVIEYYFSAGGKYYVETEQTYRRASSGKCDWGRAVRRQKPLVQSKDGVSSFIYTELEVRALKPNDRKLITQINRYCVYEAFQRLGWLYVPYLPENPGGRPDLRTSTAILQSKLAETNDDRKRELFRSMKAMLEFMDQDTADRDFFYGTEHFEYVWEKLVDRAFGEQDKEQYFPRARWLLDYGGHRQKAPLMPDTIMIYGGRYYILDAKYYRYGRTGDPAHLPDVSSINKQITYGEYLEKHKNVNADSLFNAFVMPYNRAENPFGLETAVGNIGEAVGDWRHNQKYYERIQGIVIDTRYLMHHYLGKPVKEKALLAECIEMVIEKTREKPL